MCSFADANPAFEELVRQAALKNGFAPAESTYPTIDTALLPPGKAIFESKFLSLNGNISCQTCHLDEFGSADGIPNAVAVGGEGKGTERVMSDGGILPRNTLPFWGRGGVGFDVFFWDGKIDSSQGTIESQFGSHVPSSDAFITAVHLPPAEIREMLDEDDFVQSNKTEQVSGAENIYAAITEQLKKREPAMTEQLAAARHKLPQDLVFLDYATSLATFIRFNFRLRETKFHQFVFKAGSLDDTELRGAQIFYGKGKCSACHSGAYFTDFKFHAVPIPQLGFGKNGFGVDYGRFNVTHNPDDLYKFRTPPLFNVDKTAPYGHSGSVATIREAIVFHFDPFRGFDSTDMTALERHEYFKRLATAADDKLSAGYLDDQEVDALVSFLKTLSFDNKD
jgi:cytochrome c peroxidase